MNASHVERSTVLKTVCVCVCSKHHTVVTAEVPPSGCVSVCVSVSVCVCSKYHTEVNVEVPTSVPSPLSSQNPGTQSTS